jgi:hypothetical protein
MMIGCILIGLLLMMLLYAIRTLLGMRHKTIYPLLRYHRAGGIHKTISFPFTCKKADC